MAWNRRIALFQRLWSWPRTRKANTRPLPKVHNVLLEARSRPYSAMGPQTRDFLFVGDVVQANLKAATADGVDGEVFNIAGGKATSLNELFSLYARHWVRKRQVHYGPERREISGHPARISARRRKN